MAYATIDYGTETPETVDRYGTTQTYSVFARNGRHIDHHWIIPQRTDAVIVRLGLKLLGWVSSPFHGTHTYKLDVHGRSLEILHSADGRVKLTLDGRTVYAERKRYRRNKEGERYTVVEEEYDQEQMRELREEERQARLDAARARLNSRLPGKTYRGSDEGDRHGDPREEDHAHQDSGQEGCSTGQDPTPGRAQGTPGQSSGEAP